MSNQLLLCRVLPGATPEDFYRLGYGKQYTKAYNIYYKLINSIVEITMSTRLGDIEVQVIKVPDDFIKIFTLPASILEPVYES